MDNLKTRIFQILEPNGDLLSKLFDMLIMSLIVLNIFAVVLESLKELSQYLYVFRAFEIFSVMIFTIEYALRIWTSTNYERFNSPVKGRIKFSLSPLAIVDLIAILPFYLPMLISIDLRFMRIMRLFRIFKMGRYSKSRKIFGNVIRSKKEELTIAVFIILVLLTISSSLVYFAENEAQPLAFSSIPASMWWGVATLTTVGYGDMYPITPEGKFLGAIIAILGIGMFALPAGILGSGFIEEIQKRNEKRKQCPYCGNYID
jgi:voltage-gated potassium channel